MTWRITGDLVAYRSAAWSFLAAEPERYSVLLTVLSALTRMGAGAYGGQPPVLGWWPADGPVRAAVLQAPPRPMLITALPGDAADGLAAALAAEGTAPAGVNGSEQDAVAVAEAWQRQTGTAGRIVQRQRLYRLGELSWPEPRPAGSARVAGPLDTATVLTFFAAFAEEVGELATGEGAGSVVLFTDLANPASNALYARLGYRPVEDRVVLLFSG